VEANEQTQTKKVNIEQNNSCSQAGWEEL